MEILLLDDHEIIRDGIKSLIEQEYGWTVVFSLGFIASIPRQDMLENVDVAVIDISLQEKSGFDALKQFKSNNHHIKCLMLSMYEHVGYVNKALELGADAYVTKTAATKELISALEALERDENYLSSDIANKLAFKQQCAESLLTEREKEVFLYLAQGLCPKRISKIINTMPKTVMVHRTNIYQKLGVASQFELIRIALKEGYLSLNDFITADADGPSRLAFLEFGMSTFGFYPIVADDFYLPLDLASRQAQLLDGINEACVNKWLYGYRGEYELLKQHPALR